MLAFYIFANSADLLCNFNKYKKYSFNYGYTTNDLLLIVFPIISTKLHSSFQAPKNSKLQISPILGHYGTHKIKCFPCLII